MKKLLLAINTLMFICALTIPFSTANAIDYSLDQSCSSVNGNYVGIQEGMLEQEFVPTQNRLQIVVLDLYQEPTATVGKNVTVSIIDGIEELASNTFTIFAEVSGQSFMPSIDFWQNGESYAVPLTVGHTYKIRMMGGIGASGVYWARNLNNSCSGSALITGTPQSYDFSFSTYGYNVVAPPTPTPTVAPVVSSATSNTTSTTTNTSTSTTKPAATPVKTAVVANDAPTAESNNSVTTNSAQNNNGAVPTEQNKTSAVVDESKNYLQGIKIYGVIAVAILIGSLIFLQIKFKLISNLASNITKLKF